MRPDAISLARREFDLSFVYEDSGLDADALWLAVLAATGASGVTVLSSAKHEFPGGGFTGVIVIAESHVAVHSWPEFRYAYVEMLTCGPPEALDRFEEALLFHSGATKGAPE